MITSDTSDCLGGGIGAGAIARLEIPVSPASLSVLSGGGTVVQIGDCTWTLDLTCPTSNQLRRQGTVRAPSVGEIAADATGGGSHRGVECRFEIHYESRD